MKKKFFQSIQEYMRERQDIIISTGIFLLLSFYFLGVGLKNNPIFSFSYNQGRIIAIFCLVAIFALPKEKFKEKDFIYPFVAWLVYSVGTNLFVNHEGFDISFILKMPTLFLLFYLFYIANLKTKFEYMLLGVLVFSFLLYGLKMTMVVLLGYNLFAVGENSSVIGIAIAFGIMIFVPVLRNQEKLSSKQINWIVIIVDLLGMMTSFLLGARTLVLVIFAYAFLDLVIPKKWLQKKWFYFTLFTLFFVMGVLFPIFYIWLVKNNQYISNKDFLTGREVIWEQVFSVEKSSISNFLFGVGRDRQYGRWPHEHNGFLSIMTRYGFFGLVGYFSTWVYFIQKKWDSHKLTSSQISFLIAILGVFVMSYTEPVIGIADYFVPIYFIFAKASQKQSFGEESL